MSGGGDALSFVYLLGVLLLVGSAVVAQRIPLGRGVKMAAAWILIFAAVFVVFTLKDDFGRLGRRIMSETTGVEQGPAGELRIKKSEDGHFWVDARLNGTETRFLVDSGATVTAISPETAARAGIEATGHYPVLVETANGVIEARRARAQALAIGTIVRTDFPVHIGSAAGETNLLGMNFLSTLSSWRVEGEWLVLKP